MSDTILSIRQLRKAYGTGVEALNSIDLDINPGNYADPKVLATDMLTNPACNVVFCDGHGETFPIGPALKQVSVCVGFQ